MIQELGQEEEKHHQWLGVHWLELGLLGRLVRAELEVEDRGSGPFFMQLSLSLQI